MKLPLLATRLGIIAFKVIVAAIVVLSVLPLITGDLGVDMDTGEEGSWEFTGTTLTMSVPLLVTNDGFFDINDMTVVFTFKEANGDVIAVSSSDPVDIKAGGDTEVPIGMELDLMDMDRQDRSDIIFNGTEMALDLQVSAKYAMDLVSMEVKVMTDMEWDAFISDLQVESWNAQLREEGGERFVMVPYSFHADDFLDGRQAVTVTEYSDEYGYTSNATQTVELTQQVNEEASIPLSQEAYDRLANGTANATVRTTLFFLDCSNHAEGDVSVGGGGGPGEPITNLQLMMPGSYLMETGGSYYVVIPYSFQTDPAYMGQQASVSIEYWDSTGFYGSTSYSVDMWDMVWEEAWIMLTPETYDLLNNGDHLVNARVTLHYDIWSWFDEQQQNEQWGAGL
ncbi:MAG: LEA type 2 family protein [Euryarchaeota archaeon]|nr:LEA type 2 family protein [Euryarchaeota archaeon]